MSERTSGSQAMVEHTTREDRAIREHTMTLWPDVPRVCFDTGTPVHLNACVQWVLSTRGTGAYAYINGYRRAAEAFFDHATRCQRMVRVRSAPSLTEIAGRATCPRDGDEAPLT